MQGVNVRESTIKLSYSRIELFCTKFCGGFNHRFIIQQLLFIYQSCDKNQIDSYDAQIQISQLFESIDNNLSKMIIKTAHRAVRRLACTHKIQSQYHSFQNLEGDLLRQVTKVLIAYNKIISNAQHDPNQSTLRTQLLSYRSREKTKNGQLQQQALDYAQQFFTKGIDINTQIFNQGRIENPKVANKNSLFVFTPTLSVTTPMFKALNKKISRRLFIHGNYGTSKTTSIILYCHFSYIINRYISGIKDKESFFRELGEDHKYIPRKLFYWSLESIKKDEQESQLKRILLQAPQLKIPLKKNIRQVGEQIKYKYQEKGIKCSIVFDQINSVLGKYRDANNDIERLENQIRELKKKSAQQTKEQSQKIDELNRKIESTQNEDEKLDYYKEKNYIFNKQMKRIQEQNQLKRQLEEVGERVKPFERADHFHQDLSYCFYPPIYNSSVNYQDNILVEFSGKKYSLGLKKQHGQKSEQFIDYSTHFGKEIRKKELKEFLVRQLESQLSTEYFSELKDLQSSMDAWDIYSHFVRPLTIFLAVKGMAKNIKDGKSLKQQFAKLPESINKISNENFQRKFFKFLQKQNEAKRNSVVPLLLDYLIRNSEKDQDGKVINIPLKNMPQTNHLVAQQLDKEIFKLDQSSLTVFMPIKQFKNLLMNNENPNPTFTLHRCIILATQFGRNRSVFGSKLQNDFILIFQGRYPIQLQFEEEKFVIEGSESFVHLPRKRNKSEDQNSNDKKSENKKSKGKKSGNKKSGNKKSGNKKLGDNNSGVKKHFQQILNKCNNHMNKWIFGFPVTKSQGKGSLNSAQIDFLIMRIQQHSAQKVLKIHSFDFTVTNNQSDLKKKMEQKTTIQDALGEWLNDPTNQFSDIIWQQTIVASPAAFDKYRGSTKIEKIKSKLSFRMINFTELRISKCNLDSTKVFYYGVQLMKQEFANLQEIKKGP